MEQKQLQELRARVGADLVVEADSTGMVRAMEGEGDGETLAATVSYAIPFLSSLGELLVQGSLTKVGVSTGTQTWLGWNKGRETISFSFSQGKNLIQTLSKLQ